MPDLTLRLDEADLTVTFAGVDIARYAFAPGGVPSEGPKPFLHPERALDGSPLTADRPWDHRWHKGLQMTWTHVSGQNFWGGNTYRPEHGDYALLDRAAGVQGFDVARMQSYEVHGQRVSSSAVRDALAAGEMARTDDQRAKRLAEALRENLRRRKAQAREAAASSRPESKAED